MNPQELEILCNDVCKVVRKTGRFILREMEKVESRQIEEKSLNSLVSYVDKTAEEKLVAALSQLLPGSAFLTEEETVKQEPGKYRWIIDPLDGTTNYLHKLPCFAVSVGLQENDKTVLGVVLEVTRQECFYAWQRGGAYLNGKRIQVSPTTRLRDSLIATGFPYRVYSFEREYFQAFREFMKKTWGLRRFGAAAVDLAYVACGRFDAFFEFGLNAWDVAAGALLVQEAGGQVLDFKGGDQYLFGGELLAVNAGIARESLEIVRKAMKKPEE